MRSFDDFLVDTTEARELLRDRLVEIVTQRNGEAIKAEELAHTILLLSAQFSSELLHGQMRLYHEWLSDELSGKPIHEPKTRRNPSGSNLIKMDFLPKSSESERDE